MFNGGEVVVKTLLSREIDQVFFVAGGTYITILEALSRHQNEIRSTPTRLESSAVFAAEVNGAIKRKPACIFVSRAPGAANAAIGVHTAMQASRPLVLFIADIPRAQKGREAFQEIDYLGMYGPIAKEVLQVASFYEIAEVTARALDLSITGRPGPIVVILTKDILDGTTGTPLIPKVAPSVIGGTEKNLVFAATELIRKASHPIIIAGEMVGFENATNELQIFATATGAGVITAYRQQDILPYNNPAYFGQLTLNRIPYIQEAWRDCDLVINLGSRLDSATSDDYTLLRSDQKMIMVYPEPSVFSQWQADVAMCSNVKPAIKAMIDALSDFSPPSERLHWREDIHNKEAIFAQPGEIKIKGNIDLSNVIAIFQSLVPADAIISSDAGTFGRWLQRYYRSSVTNTNFGPISGAMGYGVPGAIGAALAQPERLVFAWVGDGGFLMTGQEIATIVQEKLAVTTIVCDNASWGSILVDQQKRFPNWDFGTRLVSPNFAKLAEGYGIAGFSVEKTDEFETALQESLDNNGPSLIHLKLDLRDVSPFSGNAR